MENSNNTSGKTFLFGALIGAALAWFLSPKTGKENRKEALEKVDELKKKVEGKTVKEVLENVFGKN